MDAKRAQTNRSKSSSKWNSQFEDKIDAVSHIYNADGLKPATSSMIHSRIGRRDKNSRLIKTRSKLKAHISNSGLKNYKPKKRQNFKFSK